MSSLPTAGEVCVDITLVLLLQHEQPVLLCLPLLQLLHTLIPRDCLHQPNCSQRKASWWPRSSLCPRAIGDISVPGRLQPAGQCQRVLPGGWQLAAPCSRLNEEHRNATGFSVGKTVQYTCHPGYAKVPGMSPTITCLESGVWNNCIFCTGV
uniref:Sushi domain-containing protein n=1 Tax=Ficedula albicollis TaxID=59894 RepID=A0A803V9C2_FICAL